MLDGTRSWEEAGWSLTGLWVFYCDLKASVTLELCQDTATLLLYLLLPAWHLPEHELLGDDSIYPIERQGRCQEKTSTARQLFADVLWVNLAIPEDNDDASSSSSFSSIPTLPHSLRGTMRWRFFSGSDSPEMTCASILGGHWKWKLLYRWDRAFF